MGISGHIVLKMNNLQKIEATAIELMAMKTTIHRSISSKRLINCDILFVTEKIMPMMDDNIDVSIVVEWLDTLFTEQLHVILTLHDAMYTAVQVPVQVPVAKHNNNHDAPLHQYGLKVKGYTSGGQIYYYSLSNDSVHWVISSKSDFYYTHRKATPTLTVLCDNVDDADNRVQAYLHEYKGDYKYR
tara:strand:+ start:235 stop:792 length:558 start_codon:yes stop_codon:yes gene_type:complete